MAEIREVSRIEEWEAIRDGNDDRKVLIVKHSTTCPISAAAWRAVRNFVQADSDGKADYVMVKVIESRPVSNAIANDLRVQHQSPQALLLQGGKVLWTASHWDISEKSLEKALS
ncbi:bacillithiol system redox-active protein YtxJ [Alicyclobacillus curvatus]|jgi:bacillithiol system protein YtxJ|nr:bacillithiol system redox-active protein YtxJ [Alicyclobacillus curvatus]